MYLIKNSFLLFLFLLSISACSPTLKYKVSEITTLKENQRLMVGAAQTSIAPPPGYPMGGYGTSGRIARGLWMDLQCKSTYVQDSKGNRLAIVSCDLWSVPAGLSFAVSQELYKSINPNHRLSTQQMLLVATHTHNSQASFSTSEAYNELAAPVAGFDEKMYNFLVKKISNTIKQSIDSREAAISARSFASFEGLLRNRSIEAFSRLEENVKTEIQSKIKNAQAYLAENNNPAFITKKEEFEALDPMATSIIFRPLENISADPIAVINFLSFHPTIMGNKTDVYSPDILGVIEQDLKSKYGFHKSVISFVNGTEGDISAHWKSQDLKNTIDIGQEMASRIFSGFKSSEPLFSENEELSINYGIVDIKNQPVSIPIRGIVPACFHELEARTSEHPYPGIATTGGAEDGRTDIYFKGMKEGNDLFPCIEGHGNKASGIPGAIDHTFAPLPGIMRGLIKATFKSLIEKTAPRYLPLSVLTIGSVTIASVPGEPTTGLGYYIKRAIKERNSHKENQVYLIAGLANEYISYFTTPAEYGAQHYEGSSTMYGIHAGSFLEQELAKISVGPSDSSTELHLKPGKSSNLNQDHYFSDNWKMTESMSNFLIDKKTGLPKNNYPIFEFESSSVNFCADCANFYPDVSVEYKAEEAGKFTPLQGYIPNDHRFVKVLLKKEGGLNTWQILWLQSDLKDGEYRFIVKSPIGREIVSSPFSKSNLGKMTIIR